MCDKTVAWNFIRRFEGIEPGFYQDNQGYVTFGCGNHTALSQAIVLDWETQGREATAKEVERDFVEVREAPGGHAASWYRGYTRCRLSDKSIRKLFDDRIDEFETQLSGMFPGYGSLPDNVKLALLDMIFNLGAATLTTSFPTFCKAIKLGDYRLAADNCHRKNSDPDVVKWDPSNLHERRQCEVRDLLLSRAV
jgi:GH24 family phage-related lysozyme (muramidase)